MLTIIAENSDLSRKICCMVAVNLQYVQSSRESFWDGSTEFDELQGKRDMKCRKAIMSRFFTDQKFAYIGSTAT